MLNGLSICRITIAMHHDGQGRSVSNYFFQLYMDYNSNSKFKKNGFFKMKIAITAASGNLGKAIVKQLLQELSNEHVIAIARSPEKINFHGVEARRGDYNNRKQFDKPSDFKSAAGREHISWSDYFQQIR